MKVESESEVTQSCLTLVTPWTTAYQAPPSMGFSRRKYWSGLPLPSPDISCHNSKNWPRGNGNKLTLELKTNCAEDNQDDTGQTTDDQLEDDCQSGLCWFCMLPPPSDYKSSCPPIVSDMCVCVVGWEEVGL